MVLGLGPAGAEGAAHATLSAAHFATPEAMAAAQVDARLEYLSLAPAAGFRASLTVLQHGAVRLQDARDQAHIAQAAIAPGRIVLLVPNRRSAPGLRANGSAIGPEAGLLLGPGAELRAHAPGPQDWIAVVFHGSRQGEALAEAHGLRPGGFVALTGLGPALARLRDLGDAVHRLGLETGGEGAAGSVPAALAEALSAVVATLAALPRGNAAGQRLLRRRLRLVIEAEEILRTAGSRPVYTEDVATACGVSERTLGEAFLAAYGLPVQRVLRIHRLNQARRALSAPGEAPPLVKTVALDLGFWNHGRFALEYRQLFGEGPSETVARLRRGPPPPPPYLARQPGASTT